MKTSNKTLTSILLILKLFRSCDCFVPASIKFPPHSNELVSMLPKKVILPMKSTTARKGVGLVVVDQFFRKAPYLAAFVTCSIKASLADAIAQKYEDRDNSNDKMEVANNDEDPLTKIKRNLAFFIYGGFYQGMFQEFLINTLYPKLFGSSWFYKSIFDSFVSGPLLSLPLAYVIKGVILKSSIRDSLQKCWHEVRHNKLLLKYWAVWIPVQFITFGIIPEHLRILFIAVVAFFWLIFLSNVTCKENVASVVEDVSDLDEEPVFLKGAVLQR